MAPSGRKHGGKASKPAQENQAIRAYDFQEERKELSGSEEDIREGVYVIFLIFIVFLTMNEETSVLASVCVSMVHNVYYEPVVMNLLSIDPLLYNFDKRILKRTQ